MKKTFIVWGIVIFSLISYINLKSFSGGIGGRTRKQINEPEIGCSCHRIPFDAGVHVRITGPAQVYRNDTAVYRVSVNGGPHIKAGFDFNVARGAVDVAEPDSTQNFGEDITHRFPKVFGLRDTVGWYVKFIAPNTTGYDTLYAAANSVNGNGIADTVDRWNFSDDFIVDIANSPGIRQINNEVPQKIALLNNYPNPFNSTTHIRFQISKPGLVNLTIFDAKGKFSMLLLNQSEGPGTYELDFNASNLATGIYFCHLQLGSFSDTKKMVLLK